MITNKAGEILYFFWSNGYYSGTNSYDRVYLPSDYTEEDFDEYCLQLRQDSADRYGYMSRDRCEEDCEGEDCEHCDNNFVNKCEAGYEVYDPKVHDKKFGVPFKYTKFATNKYYYEDILKEYKERFDVDVDPDLLDKDGDDKLYSFGDGTSFDGYLRADNRVHAIMKANLHLDINHDVDSKWIHKENTDEWYTTTYNENDPDAKGYDLFEINFEEECKLYIKYNEVISGLKNVIEELERESANIKSNRVANISDSKLYDFNFIMEYEL